MKSKSECSCEPNMRELCMHCDHEKKQTQKAENNELCLIGYPHNSSNRCQDDKQAESKIFTELGKKQGQVKCSSGLVCRVSALYGDILCCAVVVVMSHPQPSLSGTRVLWVSTGTHRCVDPPRQGGGSTMRQLVHCVDCGCRA